MIAGDLRPRTAKQCLKLALIPVLSVVLLLLLWPKSKPHTDSHENAVVSVQISSAADAAGSPVHADAAQAKATRRQWPKARLADLVAFNPFEPQATPEAAGSAEDAASGGNSATGRGSSTHDSRVAPPVQLQAIFVDAQGAAAILDSQVVRVGDTLPNGGRVVQITHEGIKLEGR